MFGHCVKVYFKDDFAKYKDPFANLGIDANHGLGDIYKKKRCRANDVWLDSTMLCS